MELVLTAPLADELRRVIARPRLARYAIDEQMLAMLLELIWPALPDVDLEVDLRDPADGIVVEAAVAGRADVLVSGDRDLVDDAGLIDWLARRGIEVVDPAEFATRLPAGLTAGRRARGSRGP